MVWCGGGGGWWDRERQCWGSNSNRVFGAGVSLCVLGRGEAWLGEVWDSLGIATEKDHKNLHLSAIYWKWGPVSAGVSSLHGSCRDLDASIVTLLIFYSLLFTSDSLLSSPSIISPFPPWVTPCPWPLSHRPLLWHYTTLPYPTHHYSIPWIIPLTFLSTTTHYPKAPIFCKVAPLIIFLCATTHGTSFTSPGCPL